jgi:hypothetical protein
VHDQDIFGITLFGGLGELRSEAQEREKETLRLSRRVPDLLTLARRIVKGEGIEESEFRSGMRRREVVRGRRIFFNWRSGRRVILVQKLPDSLG